MSRRTTWSCMACGKAGHSAKHESLTGGILAYRCPLWSDEEFKTQTIAWAERAYQAALTAESDAINKLPENPSKRQTDHCWELAERTNTAMRALRAARGDES